MTVKELRADLARYDDDALVFLADWSEFVVADFPAERQEAEIEKLLRHLYGWMTQYGSGPFTETRKYQAERSKAEIEVLEAAQGQQRLGVILAGPDYGG